MRFFRGLAVPEYKSRQVVKKIMTHGLSQGKNWSFEYTRIADIERLFVQKNLSIKHTRDSSQPGFPAVCASGNELGAAHYAWHHNRNSQDDTPVIVEFEADPLCVEIDGRDFLCTVFQRGDAAKSRGALVKTFGEAILRYSERAWAQGNGDDPIALCDLARHDQHVINYHHANNILLRGRFRTAFCSAFIVKLPIEPSNIIRTWIPKTPPEFPIKDIKLTDLIM